MVSLQFICLLPEREIEIMFDDNVFFGELALRVYNLTLPLCVLPLASGNYYIGTLYRGWPATRESCEFWIVKADAEKALATGNWTQFTFPVSGFCCESPLFREVC